MDGDCPFQSGQTERQESGGSSYVSSSNDRDELLKITKIPLDWKIDEMLMGGMSCMIHVAFEHVFILGLRELSCYLPFVAPGGQRYHERFLPPQGDYPLSF